MVEVNDVVDAVYCINLARRTDRLAKFEELWKSYNLHYELFEAVDGNKLVFPENLKQDQFHNVGSVGCNLSHIKVLEEALEAGHKKILVLEDDAEPVFKFNILFDSIYSQLPEDFKFCYLGGTILQNLKKESNNILRAQGVKSTVAYIIDMSIAQKVINSVRSNLYTHVVDETFVDLQKEQSFYIFYPRIINQYSSYSDILNREVNYTWMRDLD